MSPLFPHEEMALGPPHPRSHSCDTPVWPEPSFSPASFFPTLIKMPHLELFRQPKQSEARTKESGSEVSRTRAPQTRGTARVWALLTGPRPPQGLCSSEDRRVTWVSAHRRGLWRTETAPSALDPRSRCLLRKESRKQSGDEQMKARGSHFTRETSNGPGAQGCGWVSVE